MTVRPEEAADQAAIRRVHMDSFPTAGEARLVDALREAGRLSVSLVAVEEDEVVGHVAFSPVELPGTNAGVGLAPLAVLPAARRRGVGERLIRAGLAACERSDYGFVVLLGDPDYYRRCGFLPARGWELCDEYGGGDAFQALEFRVGSIPSGGGLIRYAAEFAQLEESESD